MRKRTILLLIIICGYINAEVRVRPAEWGQKIIGSELDNFYKIDDKLYRSEQPDDDAMKEVEQFGIKQVLNLRNFHTDADEAEDTKLTLRKVKMNASGVTLEQIIEVLKIINSSKGPTLVHCWHGSDRTGVVVASYRIINQNWSKEKAIDEMRHGGYGYHARIYPNLIKLLKNLDVEKVKKAVQIKVNTQEKRR